LGYLYLALSTLLVVVWALCYKVAVERGCELRSVNLWIYIGSSAIMLAYFFATGRHYSPVAAALGFGTGISCYFATLTFFYHIRTGVLTVSWTMIGLAVGFPVAASILLWGEHPSVKQQIGLALIPIAFILCSPGRGKAVDK
jgi:drug/metabolite transporter (DMT)-like permease